MKLSLMICVMAILSLSVQAQNAEKEIQSVIEHLFDGMRAGDSTMVANAFSEDAIMQTVMLGREGEVMKVTGSLARFKQSVGTPHDQVWDEKIASYDIKIDGPLATVWTPYRFYLGDTFSHCGVNSFQLAKLDGEWKIIYIVDTRRGNNCIDS
jgi:hypothetical protein